MTGPREERFARNQVHFRSLNEQIGPAQQAHGTGALAILCECANLDCDRVVRVTAEEYEKVRSNSERFVLVPGHHLPEVEDVVDEGEGYSVVEKRGDTSEIARETDPRG